MHRFRVYLGVSAALIAAAVAAGGFLAGRFFEAHVLAEEEAQTATIVANQAHQHLSPADFDSGREVPQARFEIYLQGLPGVFRIKVFDPSQRIVWSDEPQLIGRSFPDNPYLERALAGRVTTVLERPQRAEHVFEQAKEYVAETYVPIVFAGDPRPVGVIEAYKDLSGTVRALRETQQLIWFVAGLLGAALYGALALMVWLAAVGERRTLDLLQTQNRRLTVVQGFTESLLGSADPGQVAMRALESASQVTGLPRAAFYRVNQGKTLARLAVWPPGTSPEPPSPDVVAAALGQQALAVQPPAVTMPVVTRGGGVYLFQGELDESADRIRVEDLGTLETMLQEAAIALTGAELYVAIRQAHERLAAILSGVTDRMMIMDRNLRVVWMNPAAEAAAYEPPVGRICCEVLRVPPEDCQMCPAIRTLESGQVERGRRSHRGPDGKQVHFDLITAPLRDESGRVQQVLEVARDVTELVEMGEQLKDSNQALLAAQAQLVEKERLAAVAETVAGLHHAVLNPLTGILGALQVLKPAVSGDREMAGAVEEAEAEARVIEQLVRRLAQLRRAVGAPYVGDTTILDLERSADADAGRREREEGAP